MKIILVVFGHSPNPPPYINMSIIYWFHMPAFFILSGFLFKPIYDWKKFISTTRRRVITLFVPYITFLIIDTYYYKTNHKAFAFLQEPDELIWIIFGGRFSSGIYWFITCLFFAQLLFQLLFILFKSNRTRFILIFSAYILAHIESIYLIKSSPREFFVPWNIDVSLIALTYLAFGYYGKKLITNNKIAIGSFLISILLLTAYKFEFFDFTLNMKSVYYHDLLLDLMLPIIFTLAVFGISRWIKNALLLKTLANFGTLSLPIMYMHTTLNKIIQPYFEYGSYVYTFIGVLVPILIAVIFFERFTITQLLFLGKYKYHQIKWIIKVSSLSKKLKLFFNISVIHTIELKSLKWNRKLWFSRFLEVSISSIQFFH